MNILIIILNRVHFFLTKVKNQSPLLGTSILVSLLVSVLINNIFLLIYAFKPNPLCNDNWIDYVVVALIFLMVYKYAQRNKQKVINNVLFSGVKNSLFIILLYAFTVISFIFLANINREKIFKIKIESNIQAPRKKSLEGRIKQWFNE